MKHLGDITKIDGHNIPLVDIVTGGSPCQDLSVAGKRAGLDGERSGLFMEQIRIIKEMRDESTKRLRSRGSAFDIRCVQPRYMVWENVCGAFSSNRGEDFRCVLEETAKIADPNATIPRLENTRWSTSGCVLADGWSIAWRVHDAQFWGVPQRRKRISLVADFAGQSAPEILFERKGLQGNFEQSREKGEDTPKDTDRCTNTTIPRSSITSYGFDQGTFRDIGKAFYKECAKTVVNGTCAGYHNGVLIEIPCEEENLSFQERAGCEGGGKGILIQKNRIGTLSTLNNQYVLTKNVTGVDRYNLCETGDVGRCLATSSGIAYTTQASGDRNNPSQSFKKEKAYTIPSNPMSDRGQAVIYSIGHDIRSSGLTDDEKTDPLTATDYKDPIKLNVGTIVRRLTPLECERLQGYPDGWTDIGDWTDSKGRLHKGESDSPRYKALGNSIALPFWEWMADRMVNVLKKDGVENPTMASLFDGIGGFPLVYSRCGCKPVWASEIEEFPIAVTKIRFPDDEVTNDR